MFVVGGLAGDADFDVAFEGVQILEQAIRAEPGAFAADALRLWAARFSSGGRPAAGFGTDRLDDGTDGGGEAGFLKFFGSVGDLQVGENVVADRQGRFDNFHGLSVAVV